MLVAFLIIICFHYFCNFFQEERKRIEKSGGFVRCFVNLSLIYYYYCYYCYYCCCCCYYREGRIMGIMEVSRSIGDGRFKGCGLVATPHVSRCELTENDL